MSEVSKPLPVSIPSPVPEQDARDLQLRLYREIGISAVAAALEVSVPKADDHDEEVAKALARTALIERLSA